MLGYTPLLIIVGILALSLFLNSKIAEEGQKGVMVLGIVASFVLAWLWWSFWVVKWKIWAYSTVQDPLSVYEAALEENLIWPRGSVWEKTELRIGKRGRELARLEREMFGE